MQRKVLVLLALIALVAPACNRTASGPQKFVIDVDGKSTPKEKFQFSAFFPAEIRAGAGDSIKFRNRATEAPHTITFGVKADRSNQPPIILPDGENPVVTGPCDIDDEPTTKLTKCEGDELTPYEGAGYWNSGFLQPKPAPKSAGPKQVTLKIADNIAAGEYTYVCILHPFMSGQLTVVEDEGDRSTVAEIREASKEQAAAAREDAEGFEEPKLDRDGDDVTLAAGWGDRLTSVNRFSPAQVEVDEGTTVHWEIQNPYEPHTVTFESDFEGLPPEAFAPGGVKSGEDYTGGFANSGLFGAEGTPFEGNFSLRFTKAGTYEYTCALHPGMDGVVEVTD
jgi:plastocyanin